MRAQIKVVLLVTVILTAVLGAVIWQTHTLIINDQTSLVLDSAMKQIAPLKRLVSENLETEKNELIRFAAAREAQGPGHVTTFGTFDAIALVEPSNSQWSPSWIEKSSGLRTEKWPQGYDLTLLKSLPYARVKEGRTLWVRLSDAQGAPLFAVLNSVQVQAPTAAPVAAAGALPAAPTQPLVAGATRPAILVGFATENPLASLTEDYTGSTNSVYIVDDHGYVASHVKKNYLGDSFIEDPMTKQITHTSQLSDTRVVTDIDGQRMLAHFERIEHSNLAAVIATPFAATSALASQELRTILTFGGGLGLLGLILAWIVGGTIPSVDVTRASRKMVAIDFIEDEPETFARRAIDAVEPTSSSRLLPEAPAGASISGAEMLATDRLLTERRTAFEAFSASFAARLREPLLAILGHAQLTKSKTDDTEVLAHVDSIEREARLAKEAIERFQILEESENFNAVRVNETCDIEKAVLSALAEKAIEIEGSGIYLDQSTMHVPRVRGRASDIESAVVHLLDNAIEAMRDRVEKRLTIQLTWKNDRVRFLVKDSGIGMSREVQKRAFEPFYKGFEAPRHMGLGLSFVQTTLKQIGATSVIESSPGEGTLVSIDFPIEAQARRDFEVATAPPVFGRG